MNYEVGQQVADGFFTVVYVNGTNGTVTLASQVLGSPSGPFLISIVPTTTAAALSSLVAALTAVVPH